MENFLLLSKDSFFNKKAQQKKFRIHLQKLENKELSQITTTRYVTETTYDSLNPGSIYEIIWSYDTSILVLKKVGALVNQEFSWNE